MGNPKLSLYKATGEGWVTRQSPTSPRNRTQDSTAKGKVFFAHECFSILTFYVLGYKFENKGQTSWNGTVWNNGVPGQALI